MNQNTVLHGDGNLSNINKSQVNLDKFHYSIFRGPIHLCQTLDDANLSFVEKCVNCLKCKCREINEFLIKFLGNIK